MALENWIDELVKISEITWNGKRVRGYRLYQTAEFPGAISATNIPCALVFLRQVTCEYGTGPCFDIWKGSIEYHLTPNLNRDQLPGLMRAFRLIRDAFAAHRTLGGKVAYLQLETADGPSIAGPAVLQYGAEEPHFGLVANWWAKVITGSEISPILGS